MSKLLQRSSFSFYCISKLTLGYVPKPFEVKPIVRNKLKNLIFLFEIKIFLYGENLNSKSNSNFWNHVILALRRKRVLSSTIYLAKVVRDFWSQFPRERMITKGVGQPSTAFTGPYFTGLLVLEFHQSLCLTLQQVIIIGGTPTTYRECNRQYHDGRAYTGYWQSASPVRIGTLRERGRFRQRMWLTCDLM